MKSIRIQLIVFFMILVALGSLVSGAIIYTSYLKSLNKTIDDRLSSAVHAANLAIDFSRSAEIFEEGSDESAYYQQNLEVLNSLANKLEMEYIYNMSQDSSGTWFFLFDSGDFEIDDPEEITYLYEVEEMYESGLIAVETGELIIEDGYTTDEWGTFRSGFLPIFDQQGNIVTVIGADIEASEIQDTKRTILILFLSSVLIAVAITGITAVWFAGLIVKPLNKTTESLNKIASGEGDLTKRLDKRSDNELGRMVDSYNKFLSMMNSMLVNIVDATGALQTAGSSLMESTEESASSVEEIVANIGSINKQVINQSDSVQNSAAAVTQIYSKIDRLDEVTRDQSASISESSAAIEEMVGNINAVSLNMAKLSELFSELRAFSNEGKTKLSDVLNQVNTIDTQSKSLQEANTIIAGIAAKTNLLAMNAAIEAAHAGDSGRGFSVVADEIRKLAEQSAIQSKTIGISLKEVLGSIETVVGATSETEKTFEKVINHVQVITPLESEVNDALAEQKSGSGQILEALSVMKQITSDVRDGSQEMKVSGEKLQSEIKKLSEINNEVKQSMNEIEVGAEGIQVTTIRSKDLVDKNLKSIGVVSDETGKFKLNR